MKAQYVGDIGDFGKMLLLKHLATCGFKISVNWLLTPNDHRNDGKHRDYARYKGKDCLCCCDQDVYEAILPLAQKQISKRTIGDLEGQIVRFAPDSVFFDEVFESGTDRNDLDRKARNKLFSGLCDLIFFDPDNGIGGEGGKSPKHVYYPELRQYWKHGKSILVYHHLSRNGTHQEQISSLCAEIRTALSARNVYSFLLRRGTARAYFLCVQENHESRIKAGSDISELGPLAVTKSEWAKRGKLCTKNHLS